MSLFQTPQPNQNPPYAGPLPPKPDSHHGTACLPTASGFDGASVPVPNDAFAMTGTEAGYQRHQRAGEPACPPCREANAYWKRQRRAAKANRAAFIAQDWAARAERLADLAESFGVDAEALWQLLAHGEVIGMTPATYELPPAIPNPDAWPSLEQVIRAQVVDRIAHPWTSIEQSLWAQGRAEHQSAPHPE